VDDPTLAALAFLAAAGFLAGWTDAVVGGGGLIQLPALMVTFPHAAPVQLLATNKAGSIFGTSASSITYLRRVRPDLKTATPLALAAFVGSLAGAAMASFIPREAFNPLILAVLIGVGAYTLFTPRLGRSTLMRFSGGRHYGAALLTGAVIGCYDGALGPGTGSFLVFALVGWLGYGFLEASAKAKIANFATNLAALLVFVPQGAVLWTAGLVLAAFNVAGGYLGARTAVAKGSAFIRAVFILVVGAFTVKIGFDVFAQFNW